MDNKNGRSKSDSIKSSEFDLADKSQEHDAQEPVAVKKSTPLENKSRIYQSIIEELPFALLLSDESGKILMANRKTAALLGYSSIKELIRKNPILDSIVPAIPDSIETHSVTNESGINEQQIPIVKLNHVDGTTIPVELSSFNLRLTARKTGRVTVLRLVADKPEPEIVEVASEQ